MVKKIKKQEEIRRARVDLPVDRITRRHAGSAQQHSGRGDAKRDFERSKTKAAAYISNFYYHNYRKCNVSAVLRRSQLPPAVCRHP
jgi:hypothetical protein